MAEHRALFRRPIITSIAFGNRLHEHHATLHELVAPLWSAMVDHLDVLLGRVLPYRWPSELKLLQECSTSIIGTPLILLMELVLIIQGLRVGARSIDLVRRNFRRGVLDGEVILLFVLEGDDLIAARGSLVDRSQRLEEDLV